jgi:hypothetical protein
MESVGGVWVAWELNAKGQRREEVQFGAKRCKKVSKKRKKVSLLAYFWRICRI